MQIDFGYTTAPRRDKRAKWSVEGGWPTRARPRIARISYWAVFGLGSNIRTGPVENDKNHAIKGQNHD